MLLELAVEGQHGVVELLDLLVLAEPRLELNLPEEVLQPRFAGHLELFQHHPPGGHPVAARLLEVCFSIDELGAPGGYGSALTS